jgi:pyridoxal 5'-phosphate synthase pdxT subunit
MRVGVLALQGCVAPHIPHLEALGLEVELVKTKKQIEDPDLAALILPGGESSTMLKLLTLFDLKKSLEDFAARKPVWGVCAGSILMAKKVENPAQESFAFIDLDVRRNAYGRQLESFITELAGIKDAAFIRAPLFERVGPSVKVIAEHDGHPVWVVSGKHMATSFHPELSSEKPSPCHRAFLELIR